MIKDISRRIFLGSATGSAIATTLGIGSLLSSRVISSENRATDSRPSPPGTDPTPEKIIQHLRHANKVAKEAALKGHHPFGAILVAADNNTILMEQGNIDSVNHAESTLARLAAERFSSDELWGMTLYSTAEPCAMCAGTQYWANIGRLVYGINESQLLALTGDSSENPTMDVPCRYIFDHSQKAIRVWGPINDVTTEIAALHIDFWK
jgi:tRNA(Arg) A34 adenosine deaminase TadA